MIYTTLSYMPAISACTNEESSTESVFYACPLVPLSSMPAKAGGRDRLAHLLPRVSPHKRLASSGRDTKQVHLHCQLWRQLKYSAS